jgi:hypothetical protein
MVRELILLLMTTILATGCSMVQKIGLSATGSLLEKANKEMVREADMDFFEKSAPGNIQLMEGLWYSDQENETLISNLIKAHGGYGFAVAETQHLPYQLQDEDSVYKTQAISHYTKALDFGIKFFALKGIDWNLLSNPTKVDTLIGKLQDELDEDDMTAVFYMAQSWGGLINLQRTNTALMGQLSNVKALMDWVCSKDPEFEYGSCHLFYGMYEAGRPAILGGNLEKGKKIFEDFIKKYPYNLFARVAYIQYYVIPVMDDVIYANQAEVLFKEFKEWSKQLNKGRDLQAKSIYRKHSQFNLYNAVAKKRFENIHKLRDEIF